MATPYVAGAISFLKTYAPQASSAELISALKLGADTTLQDYQGRTIAGNKKLNVYTSLKLLDTFAPTITVSNTDTSAYCLTREITYTFTGIDDVALAPQAYSFDGGVTRGTGNTYTT